MLGIDEGFLLGVAVGTKLGFFDGIDVGDRLGNEVGFTLGLLDGA